MKSRRFLLGLTTGLLCFALGWASALLLGATRMPGRRVTHRLRYELAVPQFDPPPPRFEMPPAGPSCGAKMRSRHAHEWDDVPRAEEFGLRFEVPPPPPPRPRP